MSQEIYIMDDRQRPDDSELVDRMESAPGQQSVSGGNLQRDVAARAEEDQLDVDESVTRVHASDKPRGGDRPNLPNRD
jgi:hypothetical protein